MHVVDNNQDTLTTQAADTNVSTQPMLERRLAAFWRLGYGRDHMGEWRGWRRRTAWTDRQTARGKIAHMMATLVFPLRLLETSWNAVRTLGREASGMGAPNLIRQYVDLCWLQLAYRIGAPTYYGCQLYRPERRPRARFFIDPSDTDVLIRRVLRHTPREQKNMFADKRAFAVWCVTHQLPHISPIAEISGDYASVPQLPECDLFSKPAQSSGGRGAMIWRYVGQGRYMLGSSTFTADALIDSLRQQAKKGGSPTILQRFVSNHDSLRGLSTGALATIRLVTIRPMADEPEYLLAFMRFPIGGSAADNFGAGGIAAPVDFASGTLLPPLRRHPTHRDLALSTSYHPDTGALIAGTKLPFWREAVQMSLRAHSLVEGVVPVVGWDVAITNEGPIFVEGNSVPGSAGWQMTSGSGIGESRMVPVLNSYFQAVL